MADEVKKRGRPKKQPQQENNYSQQENNQSDFSQKADREDNYIREENRFTSNRNPINSEDDDLKSFLNKKKVNKNMATSEQDIDEQILKGIEEFENSDGVNDIPSEEFNPLNEAVQKRGYTGGMVGGNSNINERIIEEPNYRAGGGSSNLEVDKDLINPSTKNNDIPKEEKKSKSGDSKNQTTSTNSQSENKESEKVNGEENVKDLSPAEKREAAAKTADAILLAYRSYVPMPFVYFSQYSDTKLKDLHKKNQLNLDTEIKKDGTTFREYYKDFNEKVEQAFVVTDAEVEAIKDPLIDVLMEKQVAFTPTQRLMFTVAQLLAAKTMTAAKFYMEKQSDIEEMKNIHKEKMEMQSEILDKLDKQEEQRKKDEEKIRRDEERIRKMEEQIIKERQATQSQQNKEEDEYEDGENQPTMNVIRNNEEEVIQDEDIEIKKEAPEEESVIQAAPTLDDAIGYDGEDEDNNDIPE